jgi:hypothetical protein
MFHQISTAVWWLAILSQFILLVVLLYRGHALRYPAFGAFILVKCIKSTVLVGLANNSWEYFWTYWIGMAFSAVIALLVLREIFKYVFAPYPTLPGGALYSFLFVLCIILFTTAFAAGIAEPAPPPEEWDLHGTALWLYFAQPYLLAANRVAELILFLTMVAICAFAKFLGLPWRHHVYGIASGFSFFYGVQIFVTSIITRLDFGFEMQLVDLIGRIAWQASLVMWITYMWRPRILPLQPSIEAIVRVRKAVNEVRLRALLGGKESNQ